MAGIILSIYMTLSLKQWNYFEIYLLMHDTRVRFFVSDQLDEFLSLQIFQQLYCDIMKFQELFNNSIPPVQ